jgi:hypothetical protein
VRQLTASFFDFDFYELLPIQVRWKGIGIDEPFPQSTEYSRVLVLRAAGPPDVRPTNGT